MIAKRNKEKDMSLDQLFQERYSVRKYAEKPIEEEKLNQILEAGRLAPTACNYQPQRIFVLQSEEALSKVRAITSNVYNAPVVLLVCYDKRESWKGAHFDEPQYDVGEMDATIVTTCMMIKAQELGIGSLWARGYRTKDVIETFDLPEYLAPVCMLDLGYIAEGCEPSPLHAKRKPLAETVKVL